MGRLRVPLRASALAVLTVLVAVPAQHRAAATESPFAGVAAGSVGPFSATVTFTTSQTMAARVAYGIGGTPTLWTPSDTPSASHTLTVTGLEPGREYTAWPVAVQEGDPLVGAPITFRTAGYPASPSVTVDGGVLQVDGNPFLPVLAMNACDPELSQSIAIGITTFVSTGRPCGGPADASLATQFQTVGGRAFVVGNVTEQSQPRGAGLLGWYQVDEPDGRRESASELPRMTPQSDGKPVFLTLTGHFFADPFPWAGADAYRAYVGAADVVGYDYYPLQGLCNRTKLGLVYAGQTALVQLAAGKPTFQWIEANRMEKDCRAAPALQVTPAVVRNETWQAIAGGARGVGYFPVGWETNRVPAMIASTTQTLAALAPALLAPPEPVSLSQPAGGPVVASARTRADARYLVVVNASFRKAQATIALPPDDATREWTAVVGKPLPALDAQGTATLTLAPLAVGVYVAGPQW